MNALLSAVDITVADGPNVLLHPTSLRIEAGEPLVVLGETGSGKSLLAQAIAGILPDGLRAGGKVLVAGRELDAGAPRDFRPLWGRTLAVLPQEPWLALDPLMRADAQVAETHRLVRGLPRSEARTRAREELDALGLGAGAREYPHRLSGGMAQRVAVAAARAGGARIVLADEPTKGLDAARRDEIAELLLGSTRGGGGLLVITHDLALARRLGGRLMVLRDGAVIEGGDTARVFASPAHEYTRRLIRADPELWPTRRSSGRASPAPASREPHGAVGRAREPVLRMNALAAERGGRTLFEGLDIELRPGEILGVTGPSGCGKSTLGDVALGLVAPSAGRVTRASEVAPLAFQKLYQDPVAAFARTRSLERILGDVLRRHRVDAARVPELMERLRLPPSLLARRPEAVSGGELQRVALLRILLVRPRFVFADEPTSRLDPLTQQQVIGLLVEMVETDGCALMLVGHDAALIRRTSDRHVELAPPALAVDEAPARGRPLASHPTGSPRTPSAR